MTKVTLHKSIMLAAVLFLIGVFSDSRAKPPERCSVGDAMAALRAFYPGLFAVNEIAIVDGQSIFTIVRSGGVGDGVANCNFRLFAAAVPFLPDSYEFCGDDVFIGGNAWSFPYTDPDAQQFLDFYYPDITGYRNKAIAELSLLEEQVTVTRATYFDANGNELPVGGGGPDDPALTDPTAGDPKLQDLVETNYRDFFNFDGKVVYRHEAFFGQFEAGTYWVTTEQFFDGWPLPALPPVELKINQCD
jgi:hypothetical protein